MRCFNELQKIRDDYTVALNQKMRDISLDFINKADIKIGDTLIPFNYENGNASFVITKNWKTNAQINFTNGEPIISVRFVGNYICYDGNIYNDDEAYCGFTINEFDEWIIKDNNFEYIRPQ
jgi:hypothetical protein